MMVLNNGEHVVAAFSITGADGYGDAKNFTYCVTNYGALYVREGSQWTQMIERARDEWGREK